MRNTFFQPNKQTWETSLRENKPIIFFFQERLCNQCEIFNQLILTDSEVEKYLYENFIPVFVDINEYPEIYDRYSESIHPFHTIHSVTGGLLGQCSANSSPKTFLRNLIQLKQLKPRLHDFSEGYGIQTSDKIFLDDSYHFHKKLDLIAEITLSSLRKKYDRMYGGWDLGGIKFHPSSALEFLMLFYHRSRDEYLLDMIVKTLRASYRGLYDKEKGGFFDYSNRDWSTVETYKKSLENNIAIVKNLFHAYLVNNDNYYLGVLHQTLNFVMERLWVESKCLFRFAIHENSDLSLKNDIFLTKSNCDACRSIIEIREIIEEIMGEFSSFSIIYRVINIITAAETEYGLPHMLINGIENQFLLQDQTAYLGLLIEAYSSSGDRELLNKCEKFTELIINNYYDKNILLFRDRITFKGLDFGPLEKILYPIRENAYMINHLVTLSHLTAKPRYRNMATECVNSYYSNFGISRDAPYPPEFVFANQRLVESPIELLIIGSQEDKTVKRMLLEMKKIYDPFKIIQILNPTSDMDLIKKKIPDFNQAHKPAAFIKIENTHSPPAFFPRDISKMLHTILDAIKYELK